MPLEIEAYLSQRTRWPSSGRHILAQFDNDSVVVYQAYRPSIGHFAVRNGYVMSQFKKMQADTRRSSPSRTR